MKQRLLAQVHASLERHAASIAQLYKTDPLEAGKLDARVNRDCIELLQLSEKLTGGTAAPSMSEAQVEAAATEAGSVTNAREAGLVYLRALAAEPHSDAVRIAAARLAAGGRHVAETAIAAIATQAGVEAAVVRAVLDTARTVLRPATAVVESPEPEPQDGTRLTEHESAVLRHQGVPLGDGEHYLPAPPIAPPAPRRFGLPAEFFDADGCIRREAPEGVRVLFPGLRHLSTGR